jgi:hypothetical protein
MRFYFFSKFRFGPRLIKAICFYDVLPIFDKFEKMTFELRQDLRFGKLQNVYGYIGCIIAILWIYFSLM